MTFDLCPSPPVTERLQDDGLSPPREPVDEEEVKLFYGFYKPDHIDDGRRLS